MTEIVLGRTTRNVAVAEAEIPDGAEDAELIIARARKAGAELLWVHGGDLAASGFTERPGYVRLRAGLANTRTASDIDVPAADTYGRLLARCYLDMWGHKYVDLQTARPPAGATVLALRGEGEYVGICRLWPDRRYVDGPGVIPESRTAERSAALLIRACRVLGEGPVEVETWGDSPETVAAYEAHGFTVVHRQRGWELNL
jgi:hypothetical protein